MNSTAYKHKLAELKAHFEEAFDAANAALDTISDRNPRWVRDDDTYWQWQELYILFQHAKVGVDMITRLQKGSDEDHDS